MSFCSRRCGRSDSSQGVIANVSQENPHAGARTPDRGSVIFLHRPDGHEIVLNADLIESIESEDGTTITLFDGRTIAVRESCVEVAQAVKAFRAQVLASANAISGSRTEMRVIPFPKR